MRSRLNSDSSMSTASTAGTDGGGGDRLPAYRPITSASASDAPSLSGYTAIPDGQPVFTRQFADEQEGIFNGALGNTPSLQNPSPHAPLQLNRQFVDEIMHSLRTMQTGDGAVENVKTLLTNIKARTDEAKKYPVAKKLREALKTVKANILAHLKLRHKTSIYDPIKQEVDQRQQQISQARSQERCADFLGDSVCWLAFCCWPVARLPEVLTLGILSCLVNETQAARDADWHCCDAPCADPSTRTNPEQLPFCNEIGWATPALYLWCHPFQYSERQHERAQRASVEVTQLTMERDTLGF